MAFTGRFFSPARVDGNGVPLVTAVPLADSQTFLRGALVKRVSGLLTECSSTPTACFGVALADANTAPGEQAANNPTVITGLANVVSTAVADMLTEFSGRAQTSGADTNPTLANVGVQYGAAKDSNGVWVINLSDTTNKILTVTNVDLVNNIWYFRFMAAAFSGA